METVWTQAVSFFKSRWYLFLISAIACLSILFFHSWFSASLFRVATVIKVDSKTRSAAEITAFGDLLKSYFPEDNNTPGQITEPITLRRGLVKISVTSANPQSVKQKINAAKIEGNKISLGGKNPGLKGSIATLKDQLLLLQNKANQVKLNLNNSKNPNTPKITKLNNPQAEGYRKHVQIYNYILSYLNKPANNFVIIPEGFNPLEADVVNYINDFNKLQYKRQELLAPELPNPVLLKRMNQELETVRQQLYAKIETEENTITAYLKAGEVSSSTQIIIPNEEQLANRRVLEGITRRQQDVMHRIAVLKARAKTRVAYATKYPLVKDLDFTVTPVINTSADEIILTVMASLIIPFGFFFTRIYFKNHPPALSIKQINKLPTIGELDKNDRPGSPGFSAALKAIAEKFSNKQVATVQQVITITCFNTDVGTSSFCLNLAGAFAEAGKKVVLMDCNLQEPVLLERLKIFYAKGLRNYFDETTKGYQYNALMHHAASLPDVALIGAGPDDKKRDDVLGFMEILTETADDTEMHTKVDAEKWAVLINGLKTNFDLVILQLPDFNVLSKSLIHYPDGDENLYLVKNDGSFVIKTRTKGRDISA